MTQRPFSKLYYDLFNNCIEDAVKWNNIVNITEVNNDGRYIRTLYTCPKPGECIIVQTDGEFFLKRPVTIPYIEDLFYHD